MHRIKVAHLVAGWLAPAAAVVLIWGALFLYLAANRTQALRGATVTTTNLAHAYEESLIRTIREVDQTLLYVRALRARDGDKVDLQPWIDSVDPDDHLAAQIAMADRKGIVTLSNLRRETTTVDLSDRPHFRHFADQPDDHLFISVPVLGRVSKIETIQFVRMLKTPDGAFDGIIVLSVPEAHLVSFYSAIDVGRRGRISVIGMDGVTRAWAGGSETKVGMRGGPVLNLASRQRSGQFTWTDPADGVARIGSFRRLEPYPLVVAVEMAASEVTAKTDEAVPGDFAVASVLTGMVVAFAWTATRRQRQAEAAHRLTGLALEHVGVGIMVVGATGRIGMLNEPARRILALPDTLRPGAAYGDLIVWLRRRGEITSSRIDAAALNALTGSRPWRDVPPVFRRTLADGRVVETRTERLDDGTTVHSFADITAADESQRTLTEARDAAEAAMRARAQFLSAMSHEIRTPLNGILGVNDLLRATRLDAEQREYATLIQQAGEHLLEMLSEILDYSKIDHQGVQLEQVTFDPAAVTREVTALLAPRAMAQDLVFSMEVADGLPPLVLGDPHRLRQVLFNLIGNAIKFTQDGYVDVKLHGEPVADGWRLNFAVLDSGIGINADEIGRLFQEFTQTDGSITRRFGGTGLGLAICKRLVTAMGGAIEVDSAKGIGSTFRFDILVGRAAMPSGAEVAAPADEREAAALIAQRAPMVLVAEDSQVNRLVARRMLERLGCRVCVAENGLGALEAVRSGGVDVVLMDVMMPEMDGLAATRAIRALPAPAGLVPVIGLSANAFPSDEEAGLAAGMTAFATKPVELARLALEISAVLRLGVAPLPVATAA